MLKTNSPIQGKSTTSEFEATFTSRNQLVMCCLATLFFSRIQDTKTSSSRKSEWTLVVVNPSLRAPL